MGRACCVSGCPSGGDAPSHQIPKSPDLFKKWKSMIYNEKMQHLTDEQISKFTVCYRHFANEDYLVTYRVRKLKRGVAPSLNLPNRPIKKEITVQDSSLSKSTEAEASTIQTKDTTRERVETIVFGLFEDPPETLEPHLLKQFVSSEKTSEQICQQPGMRMDQTDLIAKIDESSYRTETFKRKRMRLTEEQLTLFQRKRQFEKYVKTPTIQKILSFLTSTEKLCLQNNIRKSKYLPRIYIRLYHDIAKRKALGLSC